MSENKIRVKFNQKKNIANNQDNKKENINIKNSITNVNLEYFVITSQSNTNYPPLKTDEKNEELFYQKNKIILNSEIIFDTVNIFNKQMNIVDYHSSCVIPVISQKFAEIIVAFTQHNLQFIPSIINDENDNYIEDYYALHIYNYSCFNCFIVICTSSVPGLLCTSEKTLMLLHTEGFSSLTGLLLQTC